MQVKIDVDTIDRLGMWSDGETRKRYASIFTRGGNTGGCTPDDNYKGGWQAINRNCNINGLFLQISKYINRAW